MKLKKSINICLIHNNISLDNFIVNKNKYLINWDKAMFDNCIYDLLSFYKQYYNDMSLKDVFMIYEKNYVLEELNKDLLLVYLMLGIDFDLDNNELLNVKKINGEIKYLEKIYDYLKNSMKR